MVCNCIDGIFTVLSLAAFASECENFPGLVVSGLPVKRQNPGTMFLHPNAHWNKRDSLKLAS